MQPTIDDLRRHPMYTPSDLEYFLRKGYTPEEIIAFWDRDFALGHEPLHHKPVPSLTEMLARLSASETGT